MTKAVAMICIVCICLGSTFGGLRPMLSNFSVVLDKSLDVVSTFIPNTGFKSRDPITAKLDYIDSPLTQAVVPYPVSFDEDGGYTSFFRLWDEISDSPYPLTSSRSIYPLIITGFYGDMYNIKTVAYYPDLYSINGKFTPNNNTLVCCKIMVTYGLKIIPDWAEIGLLAKGERTQEFYIPLAENLRMTFTNPDGTTNAPRTNVIVLNGDRATFKAYVWGTDTTYDYTQYRVWEYETIDTDRRGITEYYDN